MSELVPPEQLLRGLNFSPIPDGWTPIEAIVLIKCLDEDGQKHMGVQDYRRHDEELLGAMTVRQDLLRRKLLADYIDSDDADDEES